MKRDALWAGLIVGLALAGLGGATWVVAGRLAEVIGGIRLALAR